jgi:hypothetical protein
MPYDDTIDKLHSTNHWETNSEAQHTTDISYKCDNTHHLKLKKGFTLWYLNIFFVYSTRYATAVLFLLCLAKEPPYH